MQQKGKIFRTKGPHRKYLKLNISLYNLNGAEIHIIKQNMYKLLTHFQSTKTSYNLQFQSFGNAALNGLVFGQGFFTNQFRGGNFKYRTLGKSLKTRHKSPKFKLELINLNQTKNNHIALGNNIDYECYLRRHLKFLPQFYCFCHRRK